MKDVEIEIEETSIREMIEKIDIDEDKFELKNNSDASKFIEQLFLGYYRPLIIYAYDSGNVLFGIDKLKILKAYVLNLFNTESIEGYSFKFGNGYFSEIPDNISDNILDEVKFTEVWIDEKDYTKDILLSIIKELDIYPYPDVLNIIS